MGVEAVPFCSFIEEFDWFFEHFHKYVHKKMAQIVPDCRRLSRMRSELRRTVLFSPWGEGPIGTVQWCVILTP